MTVSILLGKQSKVKAYMTKFEEYGSGLAFGNEVWWKEFIRLLMNNDYLIETQVKGSFGTTISLTNKGKTLRKKLVSRYPKYLDLLQECEDLNDNDDSSNSEHYSKYRIMMDTIKVESQKKTTKTKTKTKTTTTTTTTTKAKIKKVDTEELETVKFIKKEVVSNTDSVYDDFMPNNFIKNKLSKTNQDFSLDDLDNDLAELNESENSSEKKAIQKYSRKKINIVN